MRFQEHGFNSKVWFYSCVDRFFKYQFPSNKLKISDQQPEKFILLVFEQSTTSFANNKKKKS